LRRIANGRGRRLFLASVLIAALSAGLVIESRPAAAASPALVDRQTALILVREALAALDQANKTGNYTVLRDLGGPVFHTNTDARLAEVFADLRGQALDLSPVLATEPVFTLPARVEPSGLLRAVGFVPVGAKRLNFEIAWQDQAGAWKLYGIVVTASEPAPPGLTPRTPPPPAP
jgi:hypothetical protein